MRTVPLGKLTSLISSGSTPLGGANVYLESGPVMLVRSQNVLMRELNLDDVAFITEETAERMKRTVVHKNDVLLNITGASIGRVSTFEIEKVKANVNQHVCIIRSIPELLDHRYLLHFIAQPKFQNQINSTQHGGTRQALTFPQIRNFQIPLPSLGEQRRIAAILDKADGVRRKRKEAIALTEDLLRSAFLEMFGDPVTNPKGWELVELGKLLTFLTSGSRGWAKYYAKEGSLFLRIQNVKDGRLLLDDIAFVNAPDSAESRRTSVQEGDVLVSITADLGRTAVIPNGLGKAHINQHLALLRLNKEFISPEYAAAFLASIGGQLQFDRLNREGVKAGLNFDDLRGLEILLPPLEKQMEYSKFLQSQTEAIEKQATGCVDSENLFNSLLQRAFRGEL